MSPPVRGRGLKQNLASGLGNMVGSPPVRGRGLKQVRGFVCIKR